MSATDDLDSRTRRRLAVIEAFTVLTDRLVAVGRTDPLVRDALCRTAEFVLEEMKATASGQNEAESLQEAAAETSLPSDSERVRTAPPLASRVRSAVESPRGGGSHAEDPVPSGTTVRPALPRLTLGQGASASPDSAVEYPDRFASYDSPGSRVDLALVKCRLRMKADGARWAAERRKLIASEADYALSIEPNDREIIRRAKEIPGCYLWTNGPKSPMPMDLGAFEILARCYDNAGAAVGLVIALEDDGVAESDPLMQQAFQMLAEAQSALRVAATRAGGPEDSDQYELFQWLKTNTRDREIYVARHMRVNDPADPSEWQSLAHRIELFEEDLEGKRTQDKQRRKLLGKVRHKVSTIVEGNGTDEAWSILDDSVDELVSGGLPPSNRELREMLLTVVDVLPEGLEPSPGFQRVLGEIDRFLAENPESSPESAHPQSTTAPEVEQAKSLLAGKSIVLIGGERRMDREKALRESLGLREVYWMRTSEQHQPLDSFEPVVSKDDVACVILMIRWSRHGYGDVKLFCDRHGKPLVRLPGGYGANQVAKQILDQVGGRLAASNSR